MSANELVDDLFRRESGRLVAALVRLLGPAHVALAEDVVHDALISALHAWRFDVPRNPAAWVLQVAKHRAIDLLRRDRRFANVAPQLESESALVSAVDLAMSTEADLENQLAMMFGLCDESLSVETHVTLILRFLGGLSSAEIASAFLVDVATIERRVHRGRARLQQLSQLPDARSAADVRALQGTVEQALYLLFNEGYHGSDAEHPLHVALCADAIRLARLLLHATGVDPAPVHALVALVCLHAARLPTRLDEQGVLVPLAEQDRTRWDATLVAEGIAHLGESAGGTHWTRWHLEAGIALEHAQATSLASTAWGKILQHYDVLVKMHPSPVLALNRALALAEVHGIDAGYNELARLEAEPKLVAYSFYWASRADLARRGERGGAARGYYAHAIRLAKSSAERRSYQRRIDALRAETDS